MSSVTKNLTILILVVLVFELSDSKVLPIHRIDSYREVNVRGYAPRRPVRPLGRMGVMNGGDGYQGGMGGYAGPRRPGGPEGNYGAPEGPDGPDGPDIPDEGGYGGGYDRGYDPNKVRVNVRVYTGRRADMGVADTDDES